jgi:hypothetical protein
MPQIGATFLFVLPRNCWWDIYFTSVNQSREIQVIDALVDGINSFTFFIAFAGLLSYEPPFLSPTTHFGEWELLFSFLLWMIHHIYYRYIQSLHSFVLFSITYSCYIPSAGNIQSTHLFLPILTIYLSLQPPFSYLPFMSPTPLYDSRYPGSNLNPHRLVSRLKLWVRDQDIHSLALAVSSAPLCTCPTLSYRTKLSC